MAAVVVVVVVAVAVAAVPLSGSAVLAMNERPWLRLGALDQLFEPGS